MTNHSADLLAERTLERIAPERRLDVLAVRQMPAADVLEALRLAIAELAGKDVRGAILLARDADPQLIADLEPPPAPSSSIQRPAFSLKRF